MNTANLSPLVAAGVVYLLVTVPLTHAINHIDRWTNRHSNPARGNSRTGSSRRQREAQVSANSAVPVRTGIADQHH